MSAESKKKIPRSAGYKVNVEDPVPAFTAKDQNGKTITDQQLRGKPFVLYFYPKDGTSVCTVEACEFRDNLNAFQKLKTPIIGVSPDSAESHKKFAEEHGLNFPLITDKNHELASKFDVWHNDENERTTFVVNADGIISWIERRVDVNGHINRVQLAIQEIDHQTIL
jgi:peroxiredoxin Q/BCP